MAENDPAPEEDEDDEIAEILAEVASLELIDSVALDDDEES